MDNQNAPEGATPFESPAGDSDTPPPTAPVHSDGWHYTANGFERYQDGQPISTATADVIAEKLNNVLATLTTLGDRIIRLESEQIHGDDPRLADFWEKAQELADNAGHCEVFDQIAEALGGPRRTREYSVSITVPVNGYATFSVNVEARSEDDANEQALDLARDLARYNTEDHIDQESVELDWYSADYYTEEA